MAMYYQSSSEIQADGLRTLYLMNPNLVGYSDSHHHHSFLNAAAGTAHALSSGLIPHAPLAQFVDGGAPPSHDHIRPSPLLEGIQAVAQSSSSIPRLPYNLWGLPDNGNQPNTPLSLTLSASGFDKPLIPCDQHQGLLGQSTAGIIPSKTCSSLSDQSNGHNNAMILSSKYVKAAQELLDQVVNVFEKDTKIDRTKYKDKDKVISKHSADNAAAAGGKTDELTPAQRQEILMKKAKLNTMLDEVDERYRQYQQQMQAVVASFEQVAGAGSARSYTQVALRTILKQFRCLRQTISEQIRSLSRSLAGAGEFESGLRLVDHQLRQQRALQQLGMMQTTAWRPQRGLPERAVAVLRAWLFEHFLHPYPKDLDKHMLAKQTGLTRSQVSNWFINARVRLWKPMVEEMYVEEMKSHHSTVDTRDPSSKIINKETNQGADKAPPNHHFGHLVETLAAKKPQPDNSPTTIISAPANGNIFEQQHLAMPGLGGNNYFSLSLGLPPPGGQISFSRNFQFDNQAAGNSHSSLSYEILDFQNRKAAQAQAQLLPDFVT